MKIYYREKSGGIEILRCFGIEGRVEIPGMIDDKLVISAAPYAFSSHMDEKEDLKNASLWEVSDGHDEICSSRAFKAGNEGRTDMDLSGKKNVLRAW